MYTIIIHLHFFREISLKFRVMLFVYGASSFFFFNTKTRQTRLSTTELWATKFNLIILYGQIRRKKHLKIDAEIFQKMETWRIVTLNRTSFDVLHNL